jgi:LysM repeat protein
VVVDGDTLSAIAATEYGSAAEWPAIYEANRDRIGNPDLIHGGQHLRIPHYVAAATTTVSVYFVNTDRFTSATEPHIEAVQRSAPAMTPATGALTALFEGPTPAEQASSLAVWRSGATGFTNLSIADGIARVRLVGGCDSQGATFTIANLITPTLKQFATVDHVKIYDPSGNTATPDGPSDSMPDCLNP